MFQYFKARMRKTFSKKNKKKQNFALKLRRICIHKCILSGNNLESQGKFNLSFNIIILNERFSYAKYF